MFCPAPCIFLSILCVGLCVHGQSSYKSIFMVCIERRDGVSCSMYDILHTDEKGCIIMCKLVKLAFCLCCEPTNRHLCIRSLMKTDFVLHITYLLKYFDELSLCVKHYYYKQRSSFTSLENILNKKICLVYIRRSSRH